MPKRDATSDIILLFASVMTALVLFVCPGLLIAFWLPWYIGLPFALLCASGGPALMFYVDRSQYGPRTDAAKDATLPKGAE